MHAVVINSLEEYLSGMLEPAAHRDIEAHLESCERCREEMAGMQEISELFKSLHSEAALEPTLGFFGQVMQRVGERQPAPVYAGLFGLNLAFGRRLAFACLLTLAVLGSYLVIHEGEYPTGLSPESVMAQQNSPTFDSAPSQDNILVTLTTYEP